MSIKIREVRTWWEGLHKSDKPSFQTPTPLLGFRKIFVQEIPNDECYNYLITVGFECNNNGEILMSKLDADQYVEFQMNMKEMEEQNGKDL